MELLIIRHALPVRIENAEGAADPELQDIGHEQSRRLAEYLAAEDIHAIWSSPMRRAQQTAAPLSEATGLPVSVDDHLAEFDRDANMYIPIEELKATNHPMWQSMMRGDWHGTMDPELFRSQVLGAFERIVADHPGQRVAVFCHGGVINQILAAVLGLAPTAGFFHPDYTSIHRVMAASTGQRSIRAINETAHLRGSGLLDPSRSSGRA